jgi:hypothetical protein
MSKWTDILTEQQLEERYATTANLDPYFAYSQRVFWESRTIAQLNAIATQAWLSNDAELFQMARSYISILGVHLIPPSMRGD